MEFLPRGGEAGGAGAAALLGEVDRRAAALAAGGVEQFAGPTWAEARAAEERAASAGAARRAAAFGAAPVLRGPGLAPVPAPASAPAAAAPLEDLDQILGGPLDISEALPDPWGGGLELSQPPEQI